MKEYALKAPRHSTFTKVKLWAIEIAATIFFVAFVLVFLIKELTTLMDSIRFGAN
jgi:hypothetical protein